MRVCSSAFEERVICGGCYSIRGNLVKERDDGQTFHNLDKVRVADNSVLFVGATNLIPPVSTSSFAAGRHNRKNQLDR
jgi:hypothetical protein